jgi:proteasome lid subunit RPN8/RPN11
VFTRIVVDAHEEAKFIRRALRRYPLEYVEALWGHVRGDVLYVCVFMPLTHKATTCAIVDLEEFENELDDHEDQAPEHKQELLGTIHTHPDSLSVPSQFDTESTFSTQEAVMGICSIDRKSSARTKTSVTYWPRYNPLEVERR